LKKYLFILMVIMKILTRPKNFYFWNNLFSYF